MQDQVAFDRLIISGDFNYSLLRQHVLQQATSNEWRALLAQFFSNSMMMNNLSEIPTFQRNRIDTTVTSVIDYIYLGRHLQQQLQDTRITRLHSDWSDHSILQISFRVGTSPTGPGLWRANPVYASHPALISRIFDKVNRLIVTFSKADTQLSAEEKWDSVKSTTKKVIRNYSSTYVNWRKDTIKQLERKRNRILRNKPSVALRNQLINPIDKQLGQLQQELAAIDALKAGMRWRENGEINAGFLKRIHQQRTVQQHMTAIKSIDQHNQTVHVEAVSTEERTTDPSTMRDIVSQYYQQL
jgi:hypothetical protein